jgi:hypothetical protein
MRPLSVVEEGVLDRGYLVDPAADEVPRIPAL